MYSESLYAGSNDRYVSRTDVELLDPNTPRTIKTGAPSRDGRIVARLHTGKPETEPLTDELVVEHDPSRTFDVVDLRGIQEDEEGWKLYDGERWGSDVQFLLMQPSVHDVDPQRGYKALRTGDSLVLGREDKLLNDRFELSGAISRQHVSIELDENDDLVVTDRNSTNGTSLEVRERSIAEDRIRDFGNQAMQRFSADDLFAAMQQSNETPAADVADHSEKVTSREISSSVVSAFVDKLKLKDGTVAPSIGELSADIRFQPRQGVEVDGREFFLSAPLVTQSGRQYVTGYTTNDTTGVIVPRLFYKSKSDGGWRTSPYFSLNHLDKGVGNLTDEANDFGGYVQMTKLSEEIDIALTKVLMTETVIEMTTNEIREHFNVTRLYDVDPDVDTYLSSTCDLVQGGRNLDVCLPGKGFGDDANFDYDNKILPEARRKLEVASLPDGLEPDFQSGPLRTYATEHTIAGQSDVRVYESLYDGKAVHWHIASDQTGRVWVDKLVYADNKLTDYGTYQEVLVGGVVNLKPFEYIEQFKGGKKGEDCDRYDDEYVDCRKTIDRLPWIQRFRTATNIQ